MKNPGKDISPATDKLQDTLTTRKQSSSIGGVKGKTRGKLKIIFSDDLLIKKGDLNLAPHGNTFLCKELYEVEEKFNSSFKNQEKIKELEGDIENYIKSVGKDAKVRKTSETDERSDEERKKLGNEIFIEEVNKLKRLVKDFTPFKKLIFWLGCHWWYYNIDLRGKLEISFPEREITDRLAKKYLIDALPEQVRKNVENMEVASLAVDYGHFAILFVDKNSKLRRIVTDSSLYELRGVSGYTYLDVTPNGKPIARSVCEGGGGRCFFDGERLMAHEKFQTCAPKVALIDGGYKVNSTRSTIVNGMLCDLIDTDDKVAHTTGAGFMGMLDFTTKDALKSYKRAEESGKQMKVKDGKITLNDKQIKPKGIFRPSNTKLLDSGFTLFEFSEYLELDPYKYSEVMAIDDRQDFLDTLSRELKAIEKFKTHNPKNKQEALEKILKENPEVALLDMHLTPSAEFEGLWIANELTRKSYKGKIMIISDYPKDKLNAMRELIIAENVHVPGKNIQEIKKCLSGKCKC